VTPRDAVHDGSDARFAFVHAPDRRLQAVRHVVESTPKLAGLVPAIEPSPSIEIAARHRIAVARRCCKG
jgi:hypothetical protein